MKFYKLSKSTFITNIINTINFHTIYNLQQKPSMDSQLTKQKLSYILIETPIREQLLKDQSFDIAQQKISEDIKKMYQSNFYEAINVHYGVKPTISGNLNEKVYKRRKEIIYYQIELEQKFMTGIRLAKDEEQLKRIQKQYQDSLVKVKNRANQFDSNNFIPYIYIEAKQKKPLYGKLFQEFDRKGMAMLKGTIGYRTPFGLFDKIELQVEIPPLQYFKKRNYFDFGLNWLTPSSYFKGSNFVVGANMSCGPIFRGVDQKKYSTSFVIQKDTLKFETQISKRYPRIYDNVGNHVIRGYNIPSTKISCKVEKTLTDSINRGEITTGILEQAKIESTIPFISETQFVKAQYNYRKFYDIFQWSKSVNNQKLKLLLKNSNIETNLNFKAITPQNHKLSDFLENIEVRGFENDRRPCQSKLQAKASLKFNNYNYPFLGGVGIIPFLYGQAGISVNSNFKSAHALGSAGFGLSYPLGTSIQLQLLFSLIQAQNKPIRQPVNFQVRIGLND